MSTDHVKPLSGGVLRCPKCRVINYLDPYTFWDFEGNVKCAGCDTVWSIKIGGYILSGTPREVKSPDYMLPAFAETGPDAREPYVRIVGEGKTRPPVLFHEGGHPGRPITITKSIRGRPVSGRPLKPEELEGSVPNFIKDYYMRGRKAGEKD